MKASQLRFSAWFICAILFAAGCGGGAGAAPQGEPAAKKPLRPTNEAMAELFPVGRHQVRGIIRFRMTANGVMMRGKIQGLSNGTFGWSVHENGDCSAPDAKSVGPLFKPVGQLEDLNADASGLAELQKVEEKMQLDGPEGVLGKALVVHAWPYDPKVDIKGVPFIACGVIRAD